MSENSTHSAALPNLAPDRVAIRGWIEEATGQAMSVDDPLPDSIAAAAQAEGLKPFEIRCWIYDLPKPSWRAEALAAWARARRLSEGPE